MRLNAALTDAMSPPGNGSLIFEDTLAIGRFAGLRIHWKMLRSSFDGMKLDDLKVDRQVRDAIQTEESRAPAPGTGAHPRCVRPL
jgi:hypothetical protein